LRCVVLSYIVLSFLVFFSYLLLCDSIWSLALILQLLSRSVLFLCYSLTLKFHPIMPLQQLLYLHLPCPVFTHTHTYAHKQRQTDRQTDRHTHTHTLFLSPSPSSYPHSPFAHYPHTLSLPPLPLDSKRPRGKLRLLNEVSPLSFLVEQVSRNEGYC
jgi:hypothetical protein